MYTHVIYEHRTCNVLICCKCVIFNIVTCTCWNGLVIMKTSKLHRTKSVRNTLISVCMSNLNLLFVKPQK